MEDKKVSAFGGLINVLSILLVASTSGFGMFWLAMVFGKFGILGAMFLGMFTSADVSIMLWIALKEGKDGSRKPRN